MNGVREAGKAVQQRVRGRVQELIGHAEDAVLMDGTKVVPAALLNHTAQWDTISSAAPGEDQHIGIGGGYGFSRGVCAGSADEVSASGFNKLCNPGL